MRIFVCEFVTSGGIRGEDLPGEDLPRSLAAEARMMRDALVRDLSALPQVELILLAHDDRLANPEAGSVPVHAGDDPWAAWSTLAATADVVWPVAPESGGLLAHMIRRLGRNGARLVASTPEAVEATTGKHATALRLAAAGVAHIPTFPLDMAPPDLPGDRITKPDDGAGCEHTRRWPAGTPIVPAAAAGRFVIQPHVPGEPASLSVLVRDGVARLLTANRQHIHEAADGHLSLAGLTVGGIDDPDGRLARLAADVVAAFPGLSGIVGIDIILTDEGPVVVEVNPRITTAYAGLGAALGLNPASLLPEFGGDGGQGLPAVRRGVELTLAEGEAQ